MTCVTTIENCRMLEWRVLVRAAQMIADVVIAAIALIIIVRFFMMYGH